MKHILIYSFLFFVAPFINGATIIKNHKSTVLVSKSSTLDTVEINQKRLNNILLVKKDGSLVWLGKPSKDSKVSFDGQILMTIDRQKAKKVYEKRPITALEFLNRCHWIHGEGGGKLAYYYASAIENRTYMGIGKGLVGGEQGNPSDAAKKWIAGLHYGKYKPTSAYLHPKVFITSTLEGNVSRWNSEKCIKGQPFKKLSLSVARTLSGDKIPYINGWQGDDNRNGSAYDEIIRAGWLRKDVPVYYHQNGKWHHAFVAMKYKALKPSRAKFETMIKRI